MKPYGRTTKNYGSTGCCPGHDAPYIRKWSGSYSSPHSVRKFRKLAKIQNRIRRHRNKFQMRKEGE